MQSHHMVLQAPPRPHPPRNNIIIVFVGGGGDNDDTPLWLYVQCSSIRSRYLEKVVNITNYTRLGIAIAVTVWCFVLSILATFSYDCAFMIDDLSQSIRKTLSVSSKINVY